MGALIGLTEDIRRYFPASTVVCQASVFDQHVRIYVKSQSADHVSAEILIEWYGRARTPYILGRALTM